MAAPARPKRRPYNPLAGYNPNTAGARTVAQPVYQDPRGAMPGEWGTGARPMGRGQWGSKKRPEFGGDYQKYLHWWQGRNPKWQPMAGTLPFQRAAASAGGGGGGAGAADTAAAAATVAPRDPWQDYLDKMNEQEAAVMDRILRSQGQSSKDYMAALAGFGMALGQNAQELWNRANASMQAGSAEQGAYQSAAADQYTQGLMAANQQIAQDYAAIGQRTDPAIRDAEAAANQVGTVGGANPAGQMGLVGKAWNSYGMTRPGTIGFMTEQNLLQAAREGMLAEDTTRGEFAKAMLDNPEKAFEMWSKVQESEALKTTAEAKAADLRFKQDLAMAKDKREAQAAALLFQKTMQQFGMDKWSIAEMLTDKMGVLYTVDKKGNIVTKGAAAPGSRAGTAATTAASAAARLTETQAHNRALEAASMQRLGISQDQLTLNQQREERLAKGGGAKGGYSKSQIARWGNLAGQSAQQAFNGVRNAKYDPDVDPPEKEWIVKPGSITPKQVVDDLLARGIPFSIILKALMPYAKRPGSRWSHVQGWGAKPVIPVLSEGAANAPH